MRRSLWIGLLIAAAISLAACGGQAGAAQGSTNANPPAGDTTGQNPAAQNQNPAGDNQAANPQGQPQPAVTMSADETAALQQYSQLTVGILYLQDNQAGSITKDQATQLLTYYQDIQTKLQSARDANGGGPGAPDANGTPQAGGPGGNGGGPGRGPGGGEFGGLALIDLATLQADLSGIQSTLTADQLSVINALTQDQLTATMQQHNAAMPGAGLPAGQPGDGSQGRPQQQATPDPNQLATMQAQGGPGGRQGGGGSALLEEVIKVLQGIAAG